MPVTKIRIREAQMNESILLQKMDVGVFHSGDLTIRPTGAPRNHFKALKCPYIPKLCVLTLKESSSYINPLQIQKYNWGNTSNLSTNLALDNDFLT